MDARSTFSHDQFTSNKPILDASSTELNYDPNVSLVDASLLAPSPGKRKSRRFMRGKFPSGWRIGVIVSLIGALLVLLLNIILTIWVWKNPAYETGKATGTLLEGSCARVRRLNVWVHFLVNVLGTLLLCASNYCMQVLIAPTRAEVDAAHAKREWLHIGIPSLHNLMRIAGDRSLLWALLMLSSLPLHLLYNSIVFTNLQANKYVVFPTDESWLHGASYNVNGFIGFDNETLKDFQSNLSIYRPKVNDTVALHDGTIEPKYKNLSTPHCFKAYSNQYTSEFGNVYLIQSRPTVWRNLSLWQLGAHNQTGELQWFEGNVSQEYTKQNIASTFPFMSRPDVFLSNGWRCPSLRNSTCNVDDRKEVPENRSKWEPYGSPMRYCLVEQVTEICQLRFSFVVAVIVIVANCIKCFCITSILVMYKKHDALVTLGDALSSFLERPDPETRLRCLQTLKEIRMHWNGGKGVREHPNEGISRQSKLTKTRVFTVIQARPKEFTPEHRKWAHAPSVRRWFATYLIYLSAVIFGLIGIQWSLKDMPRSPSKLWNIGFGAVNGKNLLTIKMSLMGAVILANFPQFALSYLYIAFNGLYTSMFIGKEWSTYMNEHKTLRVTKPIGQQRETYWLSVPYRYAIPMTMLSSLLHWLASPGLFMVQVTVTSESTREIVKDEQISTCGYSPFGIIFATVTATVIAVEGVVIGCIRYPAGMPLASSCSAAISAACHPPEKDVDASVQAVRWGAVTHERSQENGQELVGHCTFSSFAVEQPVPGRLYQ